MVEKLLRFLRKQNSSFFIPFLIRYVIVLFIPIVIVSMIYYFSYQIVEGEVHRSTGAMLEQAVQVVDSHFKEIDDLARQVSHNPRIQHFAYAKPPLNSEHRYESIEIMGDLRYYKIFNGFIDELYIYFKNNDTVINFQSRYDPEFFYKNICRFQDKGFDQWYGNLLNSFNHKKYLPSSPIVFNDNPKRAVTYLQSLPVDEKAFWSATLVVLIDEGKIKQLLNRIGKDESSLSYVINSDNQIITSIGARDGIKPMKYDELKERNGFIQTSVNRSNMIVTYATSSANNWKYVSMVPMDVYMSKANLLRTTTIRISAVLLLLGLITAGMMAYRDYKPVKVIMDTVNEKLDLNIPETVAVNDYSGLKKIIEKSMEENTSFKTQIPTLKAGFLTKLVKGEIRDACAGNRYMELLGIQFKSTIFGVIIIYIDKTFTSAGSSLQSAIQSVCSLTADIIFMAAFSGVKLYAFSLDDDKVAVLCNFNGNDVTANKQSMVNIADQSAKQLSREYGVAVTSAISDLCYETENIHTCYQEAMLALNYRLIKGKNAIIRYDEILASDKRQDYYYSLDIETYLINMVKAGDYQAVDSLLKEIYGQNFVHRNLSPAIVRCLMFDMMSTAIKILNEICCEPEKVFAQGSDPIAVLSQCETVEELYSSIRQVYSAICSYMNRNKKSHNIRLREEIIRYIDENFFEKNLCLNTVAAVFDITPAYLCRFFKEQTGENFMDYLNKVRLKKAMYLINKDEELRISQVAEEVGYTNTNALIRLFKKYMGITPTQYREQSGGA